MNIHNNHWVFSVIEFTDKFTYIKYYDSMLPYDNKQIYPLLDVIKEFLQFCLEKTKGIKLKEI